MKTQAEIDKKKISGKLAKQQGENVKSLLVTKFAFNGIFPTPEVEALVKFLNVDIKNISFIDTKGKEDNGKEPCIKPDLCISVQGNLPMGFKTWKGRVSVKSTFAKTQVAIHSLKSFERNLKKKKVVLPPDAKEFLHHFLFANILYQSDFGYLNNPSFMFEENKRRDRFSVNEINALNPNLLPAFISFIKQNAKAILRFLISEGNGKKQNHANVLLFCDNQAKNCIFIDIDKIIDKALELSQKNNSWVVCGRDKKISGITTLSLFDGLIQLQMKGSGEKNSSTYHSLQFNIGGRNIQKKFI